MWEFLFAPMMNEEGMCKWIFALGIGFLGAQLFNAPGYAMLALLALSVVVVFSARVVGWNAAATLKYVGFIALFSGFGLLFAEMLTT